MCGSCVTANETGTDCVDSCEFEYTWQPVGYELQCLHTETKQQPEGCDGVPGTHAIPLVRLLHLQNRFTHCRGGAGDHTPLDPN